MKPLYSFRETKNFTARLLELLNNDEYAILQFRLTEFPTTGEVIKGGGGIRKLRVKAKGKSGGARVIYYFAAANELILMLDNLFQKRKRRFI